MSQRELIQPSRRGFLAGLVSCLAAPAIVRAASLMPVRGLVYALPATNNSLLTIEMITREAVRLFTNSNQFLHNIDRQYADLDFAVGSQLRIALPSDYVVRHG